MTTAHIARRSLNFLCLLFWTYLNHSKYKSIFVITIKWSPVYSALRFCVTITITELKPMYWSCLKINKVSLLVSLLPPFKLVWLISNFWIHGSQPQKALPMGKRNEPARSRTWNIHWMRAMLSLRQRTLRTLLSPFWRLFHSLIPKSQCLQQQVWLLLALHPP